MSAQPLPWTEDAYYFRDLLFHLRKPVILPKEKFEDVPDYVDTVHTIRSRDTRGPEIIHYECCLNFKLERIIQLNK
jgi:hypothetical protein